PDDDPPPPATPIPPTTPTPATPLVEISTLAQLNAIGANAESLRKNYKLMADIGGVTTPIGSVSGALTGDFNGNGRTVTVNITTGSTAFGGPLAGTYAGLFAGLGGTAHDLTVTGTVSITTSGSVYAGGVAVTAIGGGDVRAGGIVGGVQGAAVSHSHATGDIVAESTSTTGDIHVNVGGVVGAASGGMINRVYATGSVSVTVNGPEGQAGGVMGDFYNSHSVSNAVALNPSVGITGSAPSQEVRRVISRSIGAGLMANIYGKADLMPTTATQTSYTLNKGTNTVDGADVTVTGGPLPAAYTAPDESWWRGTGFSGADWTTVWRWDPATGLPALR
ncbi:MAG: FapA family protein, partial [Spirochaetaceae bacterium]|nr:FapA family protein [Spirochaetaceae bacterium]